jgi:hypothetical protein
MKPIPNRHGDQDHHVQHTGPQRGGRAAKKIVEA